MTIFFGYPWRSPPTLYFGDIWLGMTVIQKKYTTLFEGGFLEWCADEKLTERYTVKQIESRLGGGNAESWGITPHHLCKRVAKVP